MRADELSSLNKRPLSLELPGLPKGRTLAVKVLSSNKCPLSLELPDLSKGRTLAAKGLSLNKLPVSMITLECSRGRIVSVCSRASENRRRLNALIMCFLRSRRRRFGGLAWVKRSRQNVQLNLKVNMDVGQMSSDGCRNGHTSRYLV